MTDTATIEAAQEKLGQLRAAVEAATPVARKIGDGFDMTPTTYQWHCPYCKRGYETTGVAGFKAPAVMVCTSCTNAYEAKAADNFGLDQPAKQAAYAVANMDMKSPERRETLARWRQLGLDSGSVYERLKYAAMIELVHACDTGQASKPAPQQHKKGSRW